MYHHFTNHTRITASQDTQVLREAGHQRSSVRNDEEDQRNQWLCLSYTGQTTVSSIRADLIHLDDKWQEWGFPQMLEALQKWCDRNLLPSSDQPSGDRSLPPKMRDRFFNSRQQDWKPSPCVYCESKGHKSTDCDKTVGVAQRWRYLVKEKLYFKCTGTRHWATECRTLGAVRNVEACITHQSVTRNPKRCC